MILQALDAYYRRKQNDPDPAKRLPAFGLEDKEIAFILEIDTDGKLITLADTRSGEGKKKIGQRFLVPQGVKKTSAVAANLLWDNAEYVLGLHDAKKLDSKCKEGKGKAGEYLARLADMQAEFINQIAALSAEAQADAGIRAVLAFLDETNFDRLEAQPAWPNVVATNPILSFRLHGDLELVCQRPAVIAAYRPVVESTEEGDEPSKTAICLVTGEMTSIERLHPAIKGVWGAQTSGANIVSINNKNEAGNNSGQTPAFASYGKQQGYTSPVGKAATFTYTTALNHLLARDSRQRIQVGDTSTVFWSEEPHDLEDTMVDLFGEPAKDSPDKNTDAIKALYSAVESGKFSVGRLDTRFHVLGLAPNAARIAIRFWETATAVELARRIKQHFDDIAIGHATYEPEHLSLSALLKGCSRRKSDGTYDIPPNLGGEVMRAILEGLPYPTVMLNLAVQRCRAEQAKKNERTGKPVHNVSYERAAVIRAYLNRFYRYRNHPEEELTVSLDSTTTDTAYRLGRLFAVFERMQEAASERELNKTIRDSFFGSAMSTPRSVFPRLIRLNQHHLRDIKRSRPKSAGYFDGLLREINWDLQPATAYPAVFRLEEQGRFALGYYHQRQAFFNKSEPKNQEESQ